MNNDDSQRGNVLNPGNNRGMGQPKYPEKMPNYSPSTAFNYSPATGFNGGGQHPRRRNDRFKQPMGMNDRIVKQNDIIIRLLKEIRDRLPAPAYSEQKPAAPSESNVPVAESIESAEEENEGTDQSGPANEHDFRD
ncbi:MAG TPA: hypothetical protein VLX68_16795 [Chitinivibrionales bacterium]|nr:hypothetical protein [Chitinivibrionales bacterium]